MELHENGRVNQRELIGTTMIEEKQAEAEKTNLKIIKQLTAKSATNV